MKLIVLVGLPASGKTKWAMDMVESNGNYIRVSAEDIRKTMLGDFSAKREGTAMKLREQFIKDALAMKKNVIVDDNNLNPADRRALKKIADKVHADFIINDSFLEVSPEECVERDLKRVEKIYSEVVGAKTIWKLYYKWIAPESMVALNKEWEKPRAVICDLDGTLCRKVTNRKYSDLDRVGEDVADPFIGCIIDSLANYGEEPTGDKYPSIIFVSGRSEVCRKETEDWLDKWFIPYDKLFMRKENDTRSDVEVKEEIYREFIEPEYSVLGAIEDRPRCARLWRRLGIRTAQVGNPEIEF